MGMRFVESGNHTAADHTAVFIISLWQHDDVLGYAAAGNGIAAAQIATQLLSQLIHDPLYTALGQGIFCAAVQTQ